MTKKNNPRPNDLPEERKFLRHNAPDRNGYCMKPGYKPPSRKGGWATLYDIYRILTRGK
jgi:hypothetical protein